MLLLTIEGYFTPYIIIGYFRIYYHMLLLVILLVAIGANSISGYCWLFY